MSHERVYETVSAHVPCTHMEWPTGTVPPAPFACYYGESKPIAADDVQIACKTRWTVELYETRRDRVLEKALGDSLRETFGSIGREESYVENDNLLMVIYTFYEIEGEFDG